MAKLTTRNLNVRIQVLDAEGTNPPYQVQTITEGNVVNASGLSAASVGDMVILTGVSADVDGKPYYIILKTDTSVTLKGKNSLPVGAFIGASMMVATSNFMPAFCINKISGDPVKAGTEIVAKTFCGTEKMSGTPEAGSISFGGFMEDSSAAYNEFEKAAIDGKQRIMEVTFPDQAVFYFPLAISGFTFAIDPDAYVTFDASAILTDFFTKIDLTYISDASNQPQAVNSYTISATVTGLKVNLSTSPIGAGSYAMGDGKAEVPEVPADPEAVPPTDLIPAIPAVPETVKTSSNGVATHTYAEAGDYVIKFTPNAPNSMMASKSVTVE